MAAQLQNEQHLKNHYPDKKANPGRIPTHIKGNEKRSLTKKFVARAATTRIIAATMN